MIRIQREAAVGQDGHINIVVPELAPGQRVTVTIVAQEAAQTTPQKGRHVIDIVKDLPGHRAFNTAEEVDEYLRQERDSWDR